MPDAANLDFLKELKGAPGTLGEWLNRVAHLAKRINVVGDDYESSAHLYPIPFHNSAGATIPAGAVLFPGTATTINGKPGLNVSKPATTWSWTWYINALMPILDNGYGWCSLATLPVLVRTDGTTITPGMRIGPKTNDFPVTLNRDGFICVGAERDIGGVKFVPVVQNFPQELHGNAVTAEIYDNTVDVDLYWGLSTGVAGAGVSESGFRVPNCRLRTDFVEITEEVVVALMHNQPYASPMGIR